MKITGINKRQISMAFDIKNIKNKKEPYYQSYSRYQNFVKQIKNEGWNYIGDIQKYNDNIIRTFSLEKGIYGLFLDIICPASSIITICGFDDAGIDPIKFYGNPNLYSIPHFFSISCKDNNGRELSSNITVDIMKSKIEDSIEDSGHYEDSESDQNGSEFSGNYKKLYSEHYEDLSQYVDGRFRRKEERYYFYQSIKLIDSEKLSFYTNPDIDIEKTNIFMRADLFSRME